MVAAAAALTAVAACGSSGPQSALAKTARNLGDIRSGTMDLRLVARSANTGPVGFTMKGPFALPEKKGLPVAELAITELRGEDPPSSVTFVSDGTQAYAVQDGKARRIPSDGLAVGGGGGSGFGELRIESWLVDPKTTDGGTVGGTDTDKVTAGLDVIAALDGLGRFGAEIGNDALKSLRTMDDESKKHLRDAAHDSSVEVWTGKDDRLLRRLVLTVTLDAVDGLPDWVTPLAPVTLTLNLDLSKVNEPVHVMPPATG